MENHQHLFVCMHVDRWALRGHDRLSGSHPMRQQGAETFKKCSFQLILHIYRLKKENLAVKLTYSTTQTVHPHI